MYSFSGRSSNDYGENSVCPKKNLEEQIIDTAQYVRSFHSLYVDHKNYNEHRKLVLDMQFGLQLTPQGRQEGLRSDKYLGTDA